jgi:hypothetical protein
MMMSGIYPKGRPRREEKARSRPGGPIADSLVGLPVRRSWADLGLSRPREDPGARRLPRLGVRDK